MLTAMERRAQHYTTAKLQSLESQMPQSFRKSRSPSPFTSDFLAKTSRELHTYSFLDKAEPPSAKSMCEDTPTIATATPTKLTKTVAGGAASSSSTTDNQNATLADVGTIKQGVEEGAQGGETGLGGEVGGGAGGGAGAGAGGEGTVQVDTTITIIEVGEDGEGGEGEGGEDSFLNEEGDSLIEVASKNSGDDASDYASSYIRQPPKWSKYIEVMRKPMPRPTHAHSRPHSHSCLPPTHASLPLMPSSHSCLPPTHAFLPLTSPSTHAPLNRFS